MPVRCTLCASGYWTHRLGTSLLLASRFKIQTPGKMLLLEDRFPFRFPCRRPASAQKIFARRHSFSFFAFLGASSRLALALRESAHALRSGCPVNPVLELLSSFRSGKNRLVNTLGGRCSSKRCPAASATARAKRSSVLPGIPSSRIFACLRRRTLLVE